MLTEKDKMLSPRSLPFRLLVLADELDEEGWYVKANTVRKAADRLTELERMQGTNIDSSGCIFCDLDLAPVANNGRMRHPLRFEGEWVDCTRKDEASA